MIKQIMEIVIAKITRFEVVKLTVHVFQYGSVFKSHLSSCRRNNIVSFENC